MKRLTIFSILLIWLMSCRKDEVLQPIEQNPPAVACTETAQPGTYFPAYLNSWWKYTNINNDTSSIKISSDYSVFQNVCYPKLLNVDRRLSGSGILTSLYGGLGATVDVSSAIYSLSQDSIMICPISFVTFHTVQFAMGVNDLPYRRIATNLDTALVLGGTAYTNVIEVYEYSTYNDNHKYFDYFAKDIGLIKRDSVNALNSTEHIEILTLHSYHIGN